MYHISSWVDENNVTGLLRTYDVEKLKWFRSGTSQQRKQQRLNSFGSKLKHIEKSDNKNLQHCYLTSRPLATALMEFHLIIVLEYTRVTTELPNSNNETNVHCRSIFKGSVG
jgi:hypothetical protein